MEQLNWSVQ